MMPVKTNFTTKIMIKWKKIANRNRKFLLGQKKCIHTSESRARKRKLPVHDHDTRGQNHVVNIDILTGQEEKGKYAFNIFG